MPATPSPYTYRAELVRVTDGDTVVLTVDIGFRLTATMPFRLAAINCPEMSTPEGRVARAWAVQWFIVNPTFAVETAKDPEKYGRWLGTIRPPSGASLNEALVTAGMAKPYMV